jgi:hypothetical protein
MQLGFFLYQQVKMVIRMHQQMGEVLDGILG